MGRIDVVLAAGVFLNFLVRLSEHPRSRVRERSRVELRVLDQGLNVNVVGIRPRPLFDDMQRVVVRVGVLVDPDLLLFEADRIDHERVALPFTQLFSEERRIGVV